MSKLYIRSQDREALYVYEAPCNCLRYELNKNYKRGKEADDLHTIWIGDHNLSQKIAKYESKERCIEVLNEVQSLCGCYMYADRVFVLTTGAEVQGMSIVYQMPEK